MKVMTQRFIVLAALVVGVVVTLSAVGAVYGQIGDSKTPRRDPDLDLPFAEREAKYEAHWDGFTKRLAAWNASLDVASLDLGRLRHSELATYSDDSKPSLDEAVSAASRIIVGRVKELRPSVTDMIGTLVTLEVERTLKGESGGSITVLQSSTFYPTPDWKGVMILDAPGEPLMLPGNRYLLFLQEDPRFPPAVQRFSGYYELKGGTVHALELNAFRAEADGILESGFLARVDSAVRLPGGQ